MFAVEDSALPKHRKRWTNTLLFDVCYIFSMKSPRFTEMSSYLPDERFWGVLPQMPQLYIHF